jgi:hypothetical protein
VKEISQLVIKNFHTFMVILDDIIQAQIVFQIYCRMSFKSLMPKRKRKNKGKETSKRRKTTMKSKILTFPKTKEAAAVGDLDLFQCYSKSNKYFTDVDNLKATLAKFGVAIIPNVLDKKECEHMKDGMWNYLEKVSEKFTIPISRDKQETWKEMKHLSPLHSMLLKQYGIGQCQMMWDLRENPKVIEPFRKIWNTDKLISSFDGASFHFPPEVTNQGWSNPKYPFWFHTDQSYTRNKFECIQSWVTANDVNEGDATLAILEGSHKFHKEFAEHFKIKHMKDAKNDWFKLSTKEQIDWYKAKGCFPVLIQCPAGSMVVWESRTIHCGVQAIEGRKTQNTRCVGYISMMPRSLCTKANLKKREKLFLTLRTTSHWAINPKVNPTSPWTYGKPLTEIVSSIAPPTLSKVGLSLVGGASSPISLHM